MAYRVQWEARADKAYGRLPGALRGRYDNALDSLVQNPRHRGVLKLSGAERGYRVWVGRGNRLQFDVDHREQIITIIGVFPRGSGYRRR